MEEWTDVYHAYTAEEWPPSAIPRTAVPEVRQRLRKGLVSAAKHVRTIGRYFHPLTFSIFSTGVNTDVRVAVVGDGVQPPVVHFDESRFPEGDGTVPQSSAAALFPGQASTELRTPDKDLERQYKVENVTHEEICLDTDVQGFVIGMIRDLLTPPHLFEHGEITADGATLIRKRIEAVYDKDTEAELRVAKYLRQRGHEVHLIADDTAAQGQSVPDMRVDHAINVEVKRPVDMAGPNAEKLIRHAVHQVGRGGTVYVVHSDEALHSYEDFKGHAETYAQRCEAAALNVTVLVIEEKQLPPLGIW